MSAQAAAAKAALIADAVTRLPAAPLRRFVAIAGPPAAGKSTVAAHVVDLLNGRGVPTGSLPMDGFHLDNDALDRRGLRAKKGAPSTFDLKAFRGTVQQLKGGGAVSVPLFDRAQDRTLPGAGRIDAHHSLVVVEGNYLLLDAPGWRDLRPVWDFAVFLAADRAELERRLVQRWRDNGLSAAQARARAMENDLPNAELVLSSRLDVDLQV